MHLGLLSSAPHYNYLPPAAPSVPSAPPDTPLTLLITALLPVPPTPPNPHTQGSPSLQWSFPRTPKITYAKQQERAQKSPAVNLGIPCPPQRGISLTRPGTPIRGPAKATSSHHAAAPWGWLWGSPSSQGLWPRRSLSQPYHNTKNHNKPLCSPQPFYPPFAGRGGRENPAVNYPFITYAKRQLPIGCTA